MHQFLLHGQYAVVDSSEARLRSLLECLAETVEGKSRQVYAVAVEEDVKDVNDANHTQVKTAVVEEMLLL